MLDRACKIIAKKNFLWYNCHRISSNIKIKYRGISVMSIDRINNSDSSFGIGSKLATSTALGALAGGAYVARTPQWLNNDVPSDIFVRSVSQNMQKGLSREDFGETAKVREFFKAVVDPNRTSESLKQMIFDSKELSEAIKQDENETVEQAIERVYSQNSEMKIKKSLQELQYKTKVDKKTNATAASDLIFKNFDPATKKLVKAGDTSEEIFKMLKSTARKVHAKSVAAGAALGGVLAGALCLIMIDTPKEKK